MTNHELTDSRLRLLPAVGNHEGKAMLTLALAEDTAYSDGDLDDLLWSLTPNGEAKAAWGEKTAVAWVKNTLEPVAGLMRKENGKTIVVAESIERGRAFAALMLLLGDSYDVSLQRLWGATQSASVHLRPPTIRLAFMERVIAAEGIISINKMSDELKISRVAVRNLSARLLSEDLIADNKSLSTTEKRDQFEFQRVKELQLTSRTSEITVSIQKYLEYFGQGSIGAMSEFHCRRMKAANRPLDNPEKLQDAMRISLYNALRFGTVKRINSDGSLQHVILDAKQRQMWLAVLGDIKRFENGNTDYQQGLVKLGKQYIDDESLIVGAVQRAHEHRR